MNDSAAGPQEPVYLLGHSDREMDRLDLQGRLYRDTTRRCLLDAGIQEGWRVLDVGSGSGDVSLLCAELVGPTGEVVGLDREASAVKAATERAHRGGFAHVRFTTQSAAEAAGAKSFDAVVGRFILMHQGDPARFLRDVTRALRPGGSVAFVESSMVVLRDGVHSFPSSELFDWVVRWKSAVVESAGADLASGSRLLSTFVNAGLPAPRLRLEARLFGASEPDMIRYFVESVRSMMPQAGAAGVPDTLGPVDKLEERLTRELEDTGGTFTMWPTVSAWVNQAPVGKRA